MRAIDVYTQMDGQVTTRYYTILAQRGPAGKLALNLFRAQKCSSRAKVYKRRKYTAAAYDRKEWSMAQLCDVLIEHGHALMIRFGWLEDPTTIFDDQPSHVLYIDLPTGQISFHNPRRGRGPEYPGQWDHERSSQERILKFCDLVFNYEWPTHAEAFDGGIL